MHLTSKFVAVAVAVAVLGVGVSSVVESGQPGTSYVASNPHDGNIWG
jgi:hypothetical protein